MNFKRKLQAAVLILFTALAAYASQSGPEAGYTSAPGDIGACTTCHDTFENPDVGPGSVRIEGVPEVYTPGQQYVLTVTVQQGGRRRFGFQMTALDQANDRAGALSARGSDTQLLNQTGPGGRQYIEHTQSGTSTITTGRRSWQVNWTAPSTDVGVVTFYAAGNAANDDGTNQNDYIYTTRASVDSPSSHVTLEFESQPTGQALAPGSLYTIDWRATGASNIDNIEIRYTSNDGDDGYPRANLILFTTDPNVSSYDWTIPDVDAPEARIRIQIGKKDGSAVEIISGLFAISGSGGSQPRPVITNASVSGKKLFVSGQNFADGAQVYICDACDTPSSEGKKAKKIKNDSDNPDTLLVSKKAGKSISPGSSVRLQVKNPDGSLSEVFTFTRSLE
jgi:hypothetical protein